MREILKTLPKLDGAIFYTKVCGTSYYDPGHKIASASAPGYRFAYVISGKGTLISQNKKHAIEACDVYFLPKGEAFECRADKKDNLSNIWFEADGELIEKLVSIYAVEGKRVFKNCRIYNLFDEYYKNINTMIDRASAEKDNAIILHEIISEIAAKEAAEAQGAGVQSAAETIKEYIDSNYTENVSNGYLASLIGKSESQTIRIFKKAFSKTPYDYAIEKRTEAAKQLLKSTGMSVKDISEALGFSNEHYFSSCFKTHTGLTPLKYRKS